MDYQWYPGHMTKARRMMQENIKLVDLVIEIIDARIPLSSRNPDIDSLAAGKARIIVMGKADMADPSVTEAFRREFEKRGFYTVAVDSRTKQAASEVRNIVTKACSDKIERDLKRGIVNRPLRAMVCGIPNVGKSTFINSLAGRASTKTGNKPGVTRGKQWISIKLSVPQGRGGARVQKSLDLLDTPGILWPKFDSRTVGIRLALAGSIREEILDENELSLELLKCLISRYPQELEQKYGKEGSPVLFLQTQEKEDASVASEQTEEADSSALSGRVLMEPPAREGGVTDAALYAVLERIARNRNFLMKGEEPDLTRASHMLLDDFKNGRIGRITLDEIREVELDEE